jgi:23S rRNA G2445 N2-methylase RlmL
MKISKQKIKKAKDNEKNANKSYKIAFSKKDIERT